MATFHQADSRLSASTVQIYCTSNFHTHALINGLKQTSVTVERSSYLRAGGTEGEEDEARRGGEGGGGKWGDAADGVDAASGVRLSGGVGGGVGNSVTSWR